MATIYYRLIKAGLKTLDDVPDKHKAEVQALLDAEAEA
ncbi:CD1375 family protein [Brevibacillus thermoruber]|jgi:hypothetical protein|nr:CD1375 family protein [Brevibacillus thermoruber]